MNAAGDLRRLRPGDPEYPLPLAAIQGPPALLHVSGSLVRRDRMAVAVVGSRRPTPYGRFMARRLAGGLAALGVTVVSGLARGIDMEAHAAALAAGGRTLAVMGCGLDQDYPRGTNSLKAAITASGALLSEFDPGTPPLPGNFPSRNRIISGLSLGVVVVEAGYRSGSLITARWALDQGREVMAVPGRADSPLSEGPVALIREGAAPVCNCEDVLQVLGLDLGQGCRAAGRGGSQTSDPVTRVLQAGPRRAEEIALSSGLPVERVLARLSCLMIEGRVIRDEGGNYCLG